MPIPPYMWLKDDGGADIKGSVDVQDREGSIEIGGSVMLTVPPALLNALSLGTDNEVGMIIDNGRLIVEPHRRPQYSLAELLAQCDPNVDISVEEREWLDAPAVGQEEI